MLVHAIISQIKISLQQGTHFSRWKYQFNSARVHLPTLVSEYSKEKRTQPTLEMGLNSNLLFFLPPIQLDGTLDVTWTPYARQVKAK